MEYVTRGKRGTKFYEQAAELGEEEFREVVLKTREYEPKTARGKAAKLKRDAEKKPVRIAECVCLFSGGIPVRIVVEKKRTRLSNGDIYFSFIAYDIVNISKFEFNKKYAIRYNEQLESINEFIDRTRDKIECVDALA